MSENPAITVFEWVLTELTPEARAATLEKIVPHLEGLFSPGDRVLDLACGTGPFAFWLEEHGATVTAIDSAPFMIERARKEARERDSKVEFMEADCLTADLGSGVYDLVVCLGNAVLDFPHEHFPQFRDNIHRALKPGGRLALEYHDGLLRNSSQSHLAEEVVQETPEKVVRCYREYDPARGAYVAEYRNLTRGETYEYTGYVYTGPTIRLAMEAAFRLEQSIRLRKMAFLDLYARR